MSNRKSFQELEFKDAFMFATVMEDPETCRQVLERILEIPIRKVVVQSERAFLINPDKRGIRLDVYADDEDSTIFNVEMQTTFKGNLPKRSRCYQRQMDVAYLKPGDSFETLPKSFVIFICCFDPFGRGRYRYTFQERCNEDLELLGDETCKIFLNTQGKNPEDVPEDLVRFLSYVEDPANGASEDELVERLRRQLAELKHNREMEGRYMLLQEMLDQERKDGYGDGYGEGYDDGHTHILKLIEALQHDNRESDILRLAKDPEFTREMLEHYHIISYSDRS